METQKEQSGTRPGVVIEGGTGSGQQGQARNATTGEPVSRQNNEKVHPVNVERAALEEYFRDIGRLDLVAKMNKEEYKPDFGTKFRHTGTKMKSAMITVGMALLPGGILLLVYEGIRLAVPSARKWPSLIKYKSQLPEAGRPVRISAR